LHRANTAAAHEEVIIMTVADEAGDSVVLGIDIGGTKVALMAHDSRTGTDLWRDRFGTPQPARPEDVLGEVLKRASDLLQKTGRGLHDVRAIGVAVPGQVANGHVLGAGNLGWSQVPLRDVVRRQLDVHVFVEHDANAGALGESWRGVAQGMRDFVFLSVGTGLGAGVVLGGRIHRGAHHAAGEIGDMVPSRDSLCTADPDSADFGAVLGARKLREIVDAAVLGMPLREADPSQAVTRGCIRSSSTWPITWPWP
jgi:predicted NBD/HSP70 family sugar kinase